MVFLQALDVQGRGNKVLKIYFPIIFYLYILPKNTRLYCAIWQKSRVLNVRETDTSLDASGLTAVSSAVRLGADEPEAKIVVPVVRVVVVPVRGTQVLG